MITIRVSSILQAGDNSVLTQAGRLRYQFQAQISNTRFHHNCHRTIVCLLKAPVRAKPVESLTRKKEKTRTRKEFSEYSQRESPRINREINRDLSDKAAAL